MRTRTSSRLRRRRASWLALAGAFLAAGAGAASASAVPLSPELQALEEKSKELKISSERYTLDYIIKDPSGRVVTTTATGAERTSPPRAEVTETVRGKKIVVRVVGSSLYVSYPGLGRLDRGRPWVRSSESQVSAESGIDVVPGENRFSATYALLGSEAEAVAKVGPASVNGQETTEYTATVDLDRLTSLLSDGLRAELQKAGVTTARVAIFIAPDGMPLQSVVDLSVEGGTVTVSTSVVQVNGPVSVSAPPAVRTISEARFKALEKRIKG